MTFFKNIVLYVLTLVTSLIRLVYPKQEDNLAPVASPLKLADFPEVNVKYFDERAKHLIDTLAEPFDESHRILLLRFYQHLLDDGMVADGSISKLIEKHDNHATGKNGLVIYTRLQNVFYASARGTGRAGTAHMPDGPYMSMRDAADIYAKLMMGPKV